ncbi:MAG: AMP-binding protein [Ilumatobacteraceae bacterium]|nr:AMP-binding protein [Ilumatobacter sp.]MCB0983785.1 AMP-binding protein [Ilumatobacter sp.]MCB9382843.1 AMP-binding protein [Acidimicrobiaceae bacterium]
MEFHFATIWESIADAMPDRTAVVAGDVRLTWREYDERAARIAGAFSAAGLGPDSKIGLYLYNGNEYLEAHYGAFKMRGVPVNVNYRYLDEELVYLLDNADAEALVFHSSLGDRVERIRARLPKLQLLIEVDDGGAGQVAVARRYEEVIASTAPMPRIERSEDDIYMLYTGGTTGMPKGVMYDMGGLSRAFTTMGFPLLGLAPPADAAEVAGQVRQVVDGGAGIVSMPCAPLMHGTGVWLGAMIPQLTGATVVTLESRSLDPHEVLTKAQAEQVTNLVIVGDSFAKPLITAIDEAAARGTAYDLSAIRMIISSGVMWTAEVKEQLLDRIEQAILLDAMGSSEGSMGSSISMKGVPPSTAKFTQNPTTKVFTDDDREVLPGSGEVGMVAAGGMVPVGYFKDPEKSARTFRTIGGVRYSFPGDMAMVADDGSLILLGRGSQVINSGGEKIFPEEVEEAAKRVDGVVDCLVVGVPDEKFGNAVTAVVSLADGASVDEATVIAGVKGQLAGYKAPKKVVFVHKVPRAPNGKADYKAAGQLARDAAGLGE